MDLLDIRTEIDKIDDELVELYVKRMALSKEVGKVKAQSSKGAHDGKRESEILYRLSKKTPDELKHYLKELYDTVFYTSKAYQSRFLKENSQTKAKLDEIVANGLEGFPVDATVACQGVYGANSGLAVQKFFEISSVTYFKTFEGVFNAVEKGLCEYGVLPIENSTAGSVLEVYDLIKKHNFYIVKSVKMQIDHCLCSLTGNLSDIKTVVSHPQALSQCSNALKEMGVTTEISENTAIAAKKISELGDISMGVLCSRECASAYGLKIVSESLQNSQKNYTRFICIAKDLRVFKGADKISVMTSLAHTPGALHKVLARFYAFGLNLTKIESRPIEGSDFEFTFYFDFDADVTDSEVRNLIGELENTSLKFTLLGCYKESL